jgi:hypothetical protein
MADFLFRPGSLSISGGTSVVFRNVGAALHTATAQGGAWDTGFLQPGGSVALRFDVPGTYAYTCVIHPAMVGTIEVGPAAGLLSPTAAPAAAAPGPTGAIPVQPSSGLVPIDWIKGALALFLVAGAIGFFVRIIAGTPRRSA